MAAALDIATILAAVSGFGTIGTDIFHGQGLTDTPDAQVACTTYGSSPPDLAMTSTVGSAVTERPRVQVVARGELNDGGGAAAIAKAQAAWNALQNYSGTVNGTNYLYIACLQSPFYMGKDEQGRPRFGFNVEAIHAS